MDEEERILYGFVDGLIKWKCLQCVLGGGEDDCLLDGGKVFLIKDERCEGFKRFW